MTLSGGTLTVSSGGLDVGGAGGFGNLAGGVGGNGGAGTLTITGGVLTISGSMSLGGNGGVGGFGDGQGGAGGSGGLTLNSASLTISGSMTLGGTGGFGNFNGGKGGAGGNGKLMLTGGTLTIVDGNETLGGAGGNFTGGTGGIGGSGTLTLTGGVLTISNGGVSLGGAGVGAAPVVGGGGTGGAGTLTLSGGTLAASGMITLGGTNAPSGGGAGGIGTLNLDSGTLTAQSISVTSNGVLNFGPGSGQTVVVNASISGLSTQTVTFSTAGTVDLNGTTDFASVVIDAGATLQLGNGTNNGTAGAGTITDNGSLVFDFAGSENIVNNIQGTGTVTLLGGSAVLTGTNTYSGTTTLTSGTLQAGSTGAFSSNSAFALNSRTTLDLHGFSNTIGPLSGEGTVTNKGTSAATLTELVNTASTTFGGVITDGASTLALIKRGTGTFVLTGANTYTGGTTINGGTLQLGADGATGSITGHVTDNATLAIDLSSSYTFSGPITGAGSLQQNGSGTTILTVDNTYTGGTTINAGTLQLGNGGLSGSIKGDVTDDGGLAFDRSDSYTFSGVISGKGRVVDMGSGTLTLDGANTYSGGTFLDAGTLIVNDASALGKGDVTVQGGTLTADPQPINVAGNYFQGPNGALQLNIAGANPGQYDYLNVGGNATLGGTLKLINQGFTPQAGETLTLVKAGGAIANKFANFIDPFTTRTGLNTIDLVYSLHSVDLEFLNVVAPTSPTSPPPPPPPRIITINFPTFGQNPNEVAAGELLNAVELNPRFGNVLNFFLSQPFGNIPNDLAIMAPESLTAFYEISFSNANLQRLSLENRLDEVRANWESVNSSGGDGGIVGLQKGSSKDGKSIKNPVEPVLQPAVVPRFDLWTTGFGDFVKIDSDSNARGYRFTTGGFDLGFDYRFLDHFAVGVMGNYAHTWTDLRPGTITVNSGRGGLYGTYFNGGYYLNAGVYGGYNTYDSNRRALFGDAIGNTDGEEWSIFVSTGYDFHHRNLTVGPIASLQYTNVYINNFSETGSLLPMNIHSDSEESLRSDVGFRASYFWQLSRVALVPYLKATWEHEFKYSALPITAGLAGFPGPDETFRGPVEGQDSAVISAGASVQWTPSISTYAGYDGQVGRGRYNSNAVTGGVRVSW